MTKAECLSPDVDRYSAEILVLPVRAMRYPREATGARAGCPAIPPPALPARPPGRAGRVVRWLAGLIRPSPGRRAVLQADDLSDHIRRDIGLGRYADPRAGTRRGNVVPMSRPVMW
ncbi:hypothetical protein [Marinivivus vitaminiproducens]|uniref:hypothetical protein n=1 Tax=Marinivivus vitaminiproducens TaxID=3035935 RepID=UPI0027A36A7D|nr:hypothetical protein P4R82_19765 [Geminicoccaceae bacterium SCSIO 64248]